ncbi:hypothetical protein [Kineococcus esterisolvens]|uniref:hypothetical protein n=1 Tax=unclassified Kineococcus TaxID=2621656 RepID=UPI003D7CE8A4
MLSDDPAHALLLGRMAQEGETPLAVLPVASGALAGLSGSGVLAVSARQLWLAQPRLLGGPSVAAVPLGAVGAVTVRAQRALPGTAGGLRVEVVVSARPLRFTTRADRAAADAFARAVAAARQASPG